MTIGLGGLRIGHATDFEHHTGCTVLLCPEETVGSVDVRGPAPGTRETALLSPDRPVHYVNGVVLTGGSAYGLATADGVMRYLGEQGIGHYTPIVPIPIVPAAVVYDLGFSRGRIRPDAEMGYAACLAAAADEVAQGNVGAGAGVTVGKWGGFLHMMKGGFGLAVQQVQDVLVGAVAVTNCVGDVVASDGSVLAGAREEGGGWLVEKYPLRFVTEERLPLSGTNTTLVAVWTNARLPVAAVNRLAQRAHDGMAIAIRPVHATHDGDTAFALAFGQEEAPFELVANMGVTAVAEAVRNSVRHAKTVDWVPGVAG